jgi:hypothetical protein
MLMTFATEVMDTDQVVDTFTMGVGSVETVGLNLVRVCFYTEKHASYDDRTCRTERKLVDSQVWSIEALTGALITIQHALEDLQRGQKIGALPRLVANAH